MGVEAAEFRRELEGLRFGREVFECGEDRGGRHLGRARSHEDVVDRMHLEEDARVADEAGGFDVIAMLCEDGADEGAEVGRAVDDQNTMAGLAVPSGRGRLTEKRDDGFLLGRERFKDSGEQSNLEDFRDKRRRCGEAYVAIALAQIG